MTSSEWLQLPAGPALRRIVAQRLGWHMRKIWVGSNGVEYDFIVYDNDDRYIFQREISPGEAQDDQAATDRTWLEAMNDEAVPRWDEDLNEARWLIGAADHRVWMENGMAHAWVGAAQHQTQADSESLALVRAWLLWATS